MILPLSLEGRVQWHSENQGHFAVNRIFVRLSHYCSVIGINKITIYWVISLCHTFSSVQFSSSVVSDSLWPHGLQHARPSFPSSTPGVYPNSCPLSRWCQQTVLSSLVPSPPVFSLSQHQGLFKWVSSSHQVAKVLEFQLQHQSFQWTLRIDLL